MIRRPRPHRLLAALPGALMLGGLPFANRVEPYVLGLPFLLAWIVGCVVLTAPIMAWVRAIDRRLDRAIDDRPAPDGAPR
ncbi:MAG: DUF3311 domain-containing protein [Candidatus Eisenbacteria bacterium]